MEFDEDSDETPKTMSSDDDAEDFESNDINVHFIARRCDLAAEKADEILVKTLARLKIQDKGPTTESETTS